VLLAPLWELAVRDARQRMDDAAAPSQPRGPRLPSPRVVAAPQRPHHALLCGWLLIAVWLESSNPGA
jgi:hypothetical protein